MRQIIKEVVIKNTFVKEMLTPQLHVVFLVQHNFIKKLDANC